MKETFALLWACLSGTIYAVSIIDVAPLFREPASEDVEYKNCVADIDRALSSEGAFVATGVPGIHTASAMQAAGGLFSSDSAALEEVKIRKGGFMRGYLPFGQESGLQTHFEPKEGFSYGYSWDETSPFSKTNALHGDNVWPDVSPEWGQDTFESIFTTEISFAERLTECISVALNGGDRNALSAFVDPGGSTSVMRLFHYFATSTLKKAKGVDIEVDASGKTVMGSSPHTDWGYLTLILQDDVGGLQLSHGGQWVDVPYVPDSLVVNAGDFLTVLSGGHYHSPVHRVLSPQDRDRTSFVLFYYPRFETPMDPSLFKRSEAHIEADGQNSLFSLAGESGAEERPLKSFGEYIIEKWREVKAY